ncbi:MAG: spore protease YyaC [Firmicutes bacterium]|jgi:putative sporulation protein YyaC|nr:spore protease YyaC [Bacillota bacterium]HOB21291.1 spore protease YyaC [Bacillota bacterium]HQD39126.1 spore protease YyaC [Bacillota bacterium]
MITAFRPAAGENRFQIDHQYSKELFSLALLRQLSGELLGSSKELVVVCIGTDRSTGDSLGPLVGTMLSRTSTVPVYGTLAEPVHAVNLNEKLAEIQKAHPNSFIIAVDACLGKSESVGCVSIKKGPLRPGTGVNKKLPQVGDMHIIGVVNVGGFMEYFVLQNTRLNLVMKMAELISEGLEWALSSLLKANRASECASAAEYNLDIPFSPPLN